MDEKKKLIHPISGSIPASQMEKGKTVSADEAGTAFAHPILEELRAQLRRKGKVVTGEQAAAIIRNGDVVTTGGFVGAGVPEDMLIYIEERFLKEGHPRNLTVVYAAGQGDGEDEGP